MALSIINIPRLDKMSCLGPNCGELQLCTSIVLPEDKTFVKQGYQNARKPTQSMNICSIQRLNLKNSIVTQVMARIWHNSRPRKVDTFIWLTLNRGLSVGTWLQCMGILFTCKASESPQHYLFECPFTKRA